MVNVLIHTDSRYPVNRKVVRQAVKDVFITQKIENLDTEVSVAVVGRRKMDELAKKYLGDFQKHDVLAFPFEDLADLDASSLGRRGFVNVPDDTLRLGDIVLCWPEVVKRAASENAMVDDELTFLVGHGVEHLLGKHHE